MTSFGCTLMTEQAGPRSLDEHAVRAEDVGSDFEVVSDHCSPWPGPRPAHHRRVLRRHPGGLPRRGGPSPARAAQEGSS